MATKKTVKKALPKVVPFNRSNTEKLADLIFSDQAGQISCLKLCHGNLSNGKDGGRTLHCAVGEAYYSFVSTNMSIINHDEDGTNKAIVSLVEVAQLKKATESSRAALRNALERAVESNDNDGDDEDLETYVTRSAEVARIFRKEVAPLLK